jgi:hypothetical protein
MMRAPPDSAPIGTARTDCGCAAGDSSAGAPTAEDKTLHECRKELRREGLERSERGGDEETSTQLEMAALCVMVGAVRMMRWVGPVKVLCRTSRRSSR